MVGSISDSVGDHGGGTKDSVLMLPRRRIRKPMGVRVSDVVWSPGHLKFVRGHECAIAGKHNLVLRQGHLCSGRIEAAHVRIGTDGGAGMKPGDNWIIPLCSDAHKLQHKIGEVSFAGIYRIDMKAIAAALWQKSPHRIIWERKQKEGQ